MKKALITIPLTILATLAVAGTAQAHTGTASGTCAGGVMWDYHNYDKTVTNSITVTIDGTVRHHDADFKASDTGTIPTDKTIAHTWTVAVNAPGTQYDRNLSGSYQACATVPTTTVAPTTTLPATTTTEPATTTSVVAVGEPPVPSEPTPAVTAPPTSPPVTYVCVQDTFGNWIFSGTFIPCQGPPPVTASDVILTQVEPALPVTGTNDTLIYGAALAVFVGLVLLAVKGRRV